MTGFPHPAASALLADFDEGSVSRGQRYQRQGMVLSCAAAVLPDDSIELDGRVNGGGPRPYQVTVSLVLEPAPAIIMSDCNCYLGGDCKHAAALVLEWLAQGGAGPGREPRRRDDEHLGNSWLRQLEGQLRSLPGGGRLRYVLGRGVDRRKAVLSLYRERPLKGGGLGEPEAFRFDSSLVQEPRPAFVAPADLPILGQLALRQQQGAGNTLVCDQDGYLLGLLAACEHCWVGSLEGPALRRGEPRQARLAWEEQEEGWRLYCAGLAPATVVVLAEPPHYLDFDSGEYGPLEGLGSSHLLRPLLDGPSLSSDTLGLLLPRLAPLLEPLAVVPPPIAAARVLLDQKPQPCLRLQRMQFGNGRQRRELGVATLSFDYAGQLLLADTAGEWVSLEQGGEAVLMPRDMVLEAAAEQLLRSTLEPLAGYLQRKFWYDAASPQGRFVPTQQEDWPQVLVRLPARLEKAGWRLEIDPDFPWQRQDSDDWYGELAAQGDWFGLELGIEVEGRRINLLPLLCETIEAMLPEQLRELEEAGASLDLIYQDKLLRLPAGRLRPLLAVLNSWTDSRRERGQLQLRRFDAACLLLEEGAGGWSAPAALRELGQQLEDFDGLATVPLAEGFNASLRPYQQAGLNWLAFLRQQGLGGVLADDMGLGKTVQTLAFLCHEQAAGRLRQPALVVCPTSLLANWRAEAARFAPRLRLLTWHGGDRHQQAEDSADVIITSYALLARDQAYWQDRQFSCVFFDEAQTLKNVRSQMFDSARRLRAEFRLALTGTPMENHLGELWAVFEQVMPGYLGRHDEFRRHFRNPIEKEGDDTRRQQLVRRIKPLLLRRTKDQVATELPPKTVMVRPVALHGSQRDLYETVRSSMDSKLQEALARKGLARSSIEILDALLKLRQVCCDPRLLGEAAQELQGSAKLDLLFTLLPELIAEGRRILLFSQFTSMLDLIEARLREESIRFVKLTGQTRDREAPVRRFQACEVPLFLISLKAGGVGLNLTAADTVIHYDPWWNPAVEEQATDRAYRIGQDKPVFVYKLVAEGTVEERIIALQERKAALAGGIYGDAEGFSGVLAAEDLQALLQPLAQA